MRADEATIILSSFEGFSIKLEQLFTRVADLSEGQAVIKSQIATMQTVVTENSKLLRGNGVPGGLVTKIELLTEEVADLKDLIPDEKACRKDMQAIKIRVEDYPTFSWLLRYKTKQTLAITGVTIIVLLIFLPMIDHAMITALLTWAGIPAAVIKGLVG